MNIFEDFDMNFASNVPEDYDNTVHSMTFSKKIASPECIHCNSTRILQISGKTSDACYAEFMKGGDTLLMSDGYVPSDIGIGAGDYLEFGVCMECGKLQNNFPIDDGKIEKSFLEV